MTFPDDLTSSHVYLHDLRPAVRLRPLQSRPPELTEAQIDDAIARTLAEDRQVRARAALPDIVSQDELLGLAGRTARASAHGEEDAADGPPNVHSPPAAAAGDGHSSLRKRGNLARRGIIAGAVLAAGIWAPRLFAVLVLGAILMPVLLMLALGTDRIAAALANVFHRLHARNPDRAERFRTGVDRLATALDALLDRLPERWTTALYMPDFSREALLGEMPDGRPDPFDRLAAEARGR